MRRWDEFQGQYPSESWTIREPKWDPKKQQVRETQFTLGNGYFCSRGILEEVPYDSTPGTYLAGIYDSTGAQITELVNCPNPVNLRIDAYGEKLGMIAMDVVKHERALDMKDGALYRQTIFKTTHKKRVLYQSRRFVSMHNKHLGVMEVHVTPLDAAMTLNVQTTIDTSISNKGVLTEGRKIHYCPYEVSFINDLSYLCVKTFENQTLISYATSLEICRKNRCSLVADRALSLRVRKGETITFRKFFVIYTSRRVKPYKLKQQTLNTLKKARKTGLKRIYEDHVKAWSKKWRNANIEIEGDIAAEQALRFNVYHLVIAGNEDNDNVSIGARTLSGEGYRGHVFWDAEIYDVPFFIYTFPHIARNQLMYRYHRLGPARFNATSKGYKGALFPWESADTGYECTPSWAKDLDGTIIRITTLYFEHHIVADIAYAVHHYANATGDLNFLWKHGLELLIETARFWHSRSKLNKKKNRYEFDEITGPDEFHEDVKNNAFTNAMARWNLQTAYNLCKRAHEEKPKRLETIKRKLNLTPREVNSWQKMAHKIYIPHSKKKQLIEQFEGYFKLRDVRITQLDQNFIPCFPHSVNPRNVKETQLIKQADVIMLLFLLSTLFPPADKKRNYYYYEKRTMHKSSLSPILHAIMGLEVGDEDKSLHYYAHSLSTDLNDIHGNTNEGIHAASAGGNWQATIMGFAGLRLLKNCILFNPHLPEHWRGLKFAVWYQGARLRVSMTHAKTEITIEKTTRHSKICAIVYGIRKNLTLRKSIVFKSPENKKARG